MKKNLSIHFMGIGGSGISAVAQLAHLQGFVVSGCDLQVETPYIQKVRKDGIEIKEGHDPDHIKDIDILAASPANFFQKPLHSELEIAIRQSKAITWQKFLGEYLHSNKQVIGIAGTHGKSTTTAMCSLLFEDAKLDPSVMIGATISAWQNNMRFGKGKYFITESDEFFDNFLNYHPDTVILNNLEPDHPDFFKSEKQLYSSFEKFLNNLKGDRNLIFNQDSHGINKLFKQIKNMESFNLIGYSLNESPLIYSKHVLMVNQIIRDPTGSTFQVSSAFFHLDREEFKLQIPGDYNISNALGVIALGLIYGIPLDIIRISLLSFSGIGRRLELLNTPSNIHLYDDYAHHPTAVRLTLEALKQKYPKSEMLCIVEPHSFSRTKELLNWYKDAFKDANQVIIAPIFQARDTQDFGISTQSIIDVANHPNISTLDFKNIVEFVKKNSKNFDVIVVMGAGKSYQLARQIQEVLFQK